MTTSPVLHNLASIRIHCLKWPQSLGLCDKNSVRIVGNLFVLDPANKNGRETGATWTRALRTAAWLNQDGKCPCGKPLTDVSLHHALITRGDVRGCSDEIKALIDHSYNVMLMHLVCHTNVNRTACYRFLSDLYGQAIVENWCANFPLKVKMYE